MIHTVFNIAITVILMPFSKLLEKLVIKAVPDKKGAAGQAELTEPFLDARLISTPSVAIAECEHKSVEMANIAKQAIFDAIALFESYNDEDAELVVRNEDVIDHYEDKLGSYLVQLSGKDLSTGDTNIVSKVLHSIGDFERLGDHALNIKDAAQELHEKDLHFSAPAMQELDTLTLALSEILTLSAQAYIHNDFKSASQVEPLEQVIDDLIETVKVNHVSRLQAGTCTISLGFILSDILTDYERISDHCSNIAVCIIETQHSSFDTHEYLHDVKRSEEFEAAYQNYSQKYQISKRTA